jgi:xylulose-5-phosphate/fructose-6-phosphate phosphoketolase
MEGTWRAHQVPLPKAADDPAQLKALDDWLQSYDPKSLLDTSNNVEATAGAASLPHHTINDECLKLVPTTAQRRLGFAKCVFEGRQELKVPDWKQFGYERGKDVRLSSLSASATAITSGWLFSLIDDRFYIFILRCRSAP